MTVVRAEVVGDVDVDVEAESADEGATGAVLDADEAARSEIDGEDAEGNEGEIVCKSSDDESFNSAKNPDADPPERCVGLCFEDVNDELPLLSLSFPETEEERGERDQSGT
jgi:hypothetical protein